MPSTRGGRRWAARGLETHFPQFGPRARALRLGHLRFHRFSSSTPRLCLRAPPSAPPGQPPPPPPRRGPRLLGGAWAPERRRRGGGVAPAGAGGRPSRPCRSSRRGSGGGWGAARAGRASPPGGSRWGRWGATAGGRGPRRPPPPPPPPPPSPPPLPSPAGWSNAPNRLRVESLALAGGVPGSSRLHNPPRRLPDPCCCPACRGLLGTASLGHLRERRQNCRR